MSHAGATREFDYSKEGAYGTHYLGFYAECKHDIRPVTSGHRLALVYNLVQTENVQTENLVQTEKFEFLRPVHPIIAILCQQSSNRLAI